MIYKKLLQLLKKFYVTYKFFCNPALPYPINAAGSSGAQGNAVSSVYFLRHDEQGVQMVEQIKSTIINFAVSVKAKLKKSMLIPRQSFTFSFV